MKMALTEVAPLNREYALDYCRIEELKCARTFHCKGLKMALFTLEALMLQFGIREKLTGSQNCNLLWLFFPFYIIVSSGKSLFHFYKQDK